MASLYESYTTSYDDATFATGGGRTRQCQTFTPEVAHVLTAVKLRMYRSSTSLTGTLYCGIFATSSGLPTGSALVSATIDYSALGTSYPGEIVEIPFDPGIEVEAGLTYAIVIWMSGGSNSYSIRLIYKMVGTYGGGARVVTDDYGANWSITAGDLYFEEWGEPVGEPCTIAAVSSMVVRSSGIDFAPAYWPWTWPVVETLTFNTEILESHNRTEQRIARHGGIPRSQFRTTVLLAGDEEVASFDAVMDGWLKHTWPVPLWPQAKRHAAILLAGVDEIGLDTRYAEFRDDSYGLIWQPDQYEIIKIDSKTDTALVLSNDLTKDLFGDKWIVPLRRGYVLDTPNKQRLIGGAALVEMTWLVVDNAAVTGHVAAMTYDDLEVLTSPTFADGDNFRETHDPDVALLDAGTSPFEVISNSDENLVRQRHVWQCVTEAQCWSLRQFLHAMRGRQVAFLVPTFRSDLMLTRYVSSTDTSLYIRNGGYARKMGDGSLRQYVAFRPTPTEIIVRKVTGLSVVSTEEERIDLDAAPEQAFAAGGMVSWVDKCRLADDTVELQWRGHGELSCAVDLVRCP